mgnify:CR=1 FL=1
MTAIKFFIFFWIALIIGTFGLSNIILPLFYSIPRINREERNGNLIKKIPFLMIIWAPITWFLALTIGLYFAQKYLQIYMTPIYIGLSVALIVTVHRLSNKHTDLDDDFRKTYKDFLIK